MGILRGWKQCQPIGVGPPKVGGLYLLSIPGTPQFILKVTDRHGARRAARSLPHSPELWYDPTSTVRDHLNIVTGDFIDGDWLWVPIVNMNVVPTPPDPPAITNLTAGPGQVSVAFSAPADQGTGPITSYTVTASQPAARRSQQGLAPRSRSLG